MMNEVILNLKQFTEKKNHIRKIGFSIIFGNLPTLKPQKQPIIQVLQSS